MNIKLPDCVGCARCCLGITDITENDYIRLSEYSYKDGDKYFMNRKSFNGMDVCVFLDTESYKCSNYENRPIACAEYKRGGAGCINVLSKSPHFILKKINDIWN